jgi:hypothetical protein
MYEYLWMQRPILALVHQNPQMQAILEGQGHRVVRSDGGDPAATGERLARELEPLVERWEGARLADSGLASPFTTAAAVESLVTWVSGSALK